jgi:hypothetical protein
MNQAHQHHLCNVYGLVRVFPEQICHNCHVPRMFGVIFVPASVGQVCLPEYIFHFVDFQSKRYLLFNTLIHLIASAGYIRYTFLFRSLCLAFDSQGIIFPFIFFMQLLFDSR